MHSQAVISAPGHLYGAAFLGLLQPLPKPFHPQESSRNEREISKAHAFGTPITNLIRLAYQTVVFN